MTLGTPGNTAPNVSPRTPVTFSGLPCAPRTGVTAASSSATPITSQVRVFIGFRPPCDSAGRGKVYPLPAHITSSTPWTRLVDHRHRDVGRVDTLRLVRRRGYARADPHKQRTRAAEARVSTGHRVERHAADLRAGGCMDTS